MAKPTASDPLGQREDPADFGDMLNRVVDARIQLALLGRTSTRFDGVPSQELLLELIARGFAVYRPQGPIDT